MIPDAIQKSSRNEHKYFLGEAILTQTPNVIFTPFKNTEGGVSAIQIELSPTPRSGPIAGFFDLSKRDAPLLEIDVSGMDAEEAKALVQKMVDDAFVGLVGDQRDIRDRIGARGDEAAGVVGVGKFIWKHGSTFIKWIGTTLATIAAEKVVEKAVDKISGPSQESGEQKETKPKTDDGENQDAGTSGNEEDPNKPKKSKSTPDPEETGGAMTPDQILRISIELKNYVPPARDDREDQQSGTKVLKKPIDPNYDPAINWGADDPNKRNPHITTRIVANDGFTDPIPFRTFAASTGRKQ